MTISCRYCIAFEVMSLFLVSGLSDNSSAATAAEDDQLDWLTSVYFCFKISNVSNGI